MFVETKSYFSTSKTDFERGVYEIITFASSSILSNNSLTLNEGILGGRKGPTNANKR